MSSRQSVFQDSGYDWPTTWRRRIYGRVDRVDVQLRIYSFYLVKVQKRLELRMLVLAPVSIAIHTYSYKVFYRCLLGLLDLRRTHQVSENHKINADRRGLTISYESHLIRIYIK